MRADAGFPCPWPKTNARLAGTTLRSTVGGSKALSWPFWLKEYLEDGLDLRLAKSTHRWLQDAQSQAAASRPPWEKRGYCAHHFGILLAQAMRPTKKRSLRLQASKIFVKKKTQTGSTANQNCFDVRRGTPAGNRQAGSGMKSNSEAASRSEVGRILVATEPPDDWVTAWFSKTIADRFLRGSHLHACRLA